MAQPGLSLSVSSVEEELKSGKPVHFLNFRFSTAHQKWDLEQVHRKIMERGWEKLPDLDSSYVWFGSTPPEFLDILEKASYGNHTCRYMSGSLTHMGQLEGTGVAPVVGEVTAPTNTLRNYGFKAEPVSQIAKKLPDVEPVKPAMDED